MAAAVGVGVAVAVGVGAAVAVGVGAAVAVGVGVAVAVDVGVAVAVGVGISGAAGVDAGDTAGVRASVPGTFGVEVAGGASWASQAATRTASVAQIASKRTARRRLPPVADSGGFSTGKRQAD